MNDDDMKQALEHDEARKSAEPKLPISREVARALFPDGGLYPGHATSPSDWMIPAGSEAAKRPWATPQVTTHAPSSPREQEYPPDLKPLRLRKGQRAALIWDDNGSCVEYHLRQEEAAAGVGMRVRVAAGILAQMCTHTHASIDSPEELRRDARAALVLADVLLAEAAR